MPIARINERIRVPEVRVIGDEGEQLGVMDIRDAIRAAREKGLDLVEVAATADPPVCRIIDFGKFQYEAKKKANEAKKKQVTITAIAWSARAAGSAKATKFAPLSLFADAK